MCSTEQSVVYTVSDGSAVGSADGRHILAVGDSVMLGAAPSLQDAFADIKADVVEGLQEYNAIDEVAKLLNQDPEIDNDARSIYCYQYIWRCEFREKLQECAVREDLKSYLKKTLRIWRHI